MYDRRDMRTGVKVPKEPRSNCGEETNRGKPQTKRRGARAGDTNGDRPSYSASRVASAHPHTRPADERIELWLQTAPRSARGAKSREQLCTRGLPSGSRLGLGKVLRLGQTRHPHGEDEPQDSDKRVLWYIRQMLKAGMMDKEGVCHKREQGTPQGGPLSPLPANVLLDEPDKEPRNAGCDFADTRMTASSS